MIQNGVCIQYDDIAIGAKENFSAQTGDSAFDSLSQLQMHNLQFENYANPCELYSVLLDGDAVPFNPQDKKQNIGFWSNRISSENGDFLDESGAPNPIILEMFSNGYFTSAGLTLQFDTDNQIFPRSVKVQWARLTNAEEIILDEKTFEVEEALFVCHNFVENYNLLRFEFPSLNMPQNRLRLRSIDYGFSAFFRGDEIKNAKIIQEINPISTEIIINTSDFTIDTLGNVEYSFQEKQPLRVYFDKKLKEKTFISSVLRKSQKIWSIKSEDYIGLMSSVPYYGGMYDGEGAYEVLKDIFDTAKVPYKINDSLKGVPLHGFIPFTNCRDALMQVCFAVQNIADTSYSEVVNVYDLPEESSQNISLERIMRGQNFSYEEVVTGVEISVHNYEPIYEIIDIYKASESGAGENIFVKFAQPLHNLEISDGEIINCGANYAIINAGSDAVLSGYKYNHTTQIRRKNNPIVSSNVFEKIIAVENATLVSANNIDKVLEKCYNYFEKTKQVNLKIAEGKHEVSAFGNYYGNALYGTIVYYNPDSIGEGIIYDKETKVGEKIDCETESLGTISGRIIRQSYSLNGGIIIKDTTLKEG